jgi:hypothetical protein
VTTASLNFTKRSCLVHRMKLILPIICLLLTSCSPVCLETTINSRESALKVFREHVIIHYTKLLAQFGVDSILLFDRAILNSETDAERLLTDICKHPDYYAVVTKYDGDIYYRPAMFSVQVGYISKGSCDDCWNRLDLSGHLNSCGKVDGVINIFYNNSKLTDGTMSSNPYTKPRACPPMLAVPKPQER